METFVVDPAQMAADATAVLLAAFNDDTPGLTTLLQNRNSTELLHISAFLAAYAARKATQHDALTGQDTPTVLRHATITHYATASTTTD